MLMRYAVRFILANCGAATQTDRLRRLRAAITTKSPCNSSSNRSIGQTSRIASQVRTIGSTPSTLIPKARAAVDFRPDLAHPDDAERHFRKLEVAAVDVVDHTRPDRERRPRLLTPTGAQRPSLCCRMYVCRFRAKHRT